MTSSVPAARPGRPASAPAACSRESSSCRRACATRWLSLRSTSTSTQPSGRPSRPGTTSSRTPTGNGSPPSRCSASSPRQGCAARSRPSMARRRASGWVNRPGNCSTRCKARRRARRTSVAKAWLTNSRQPAAVGDGHRLARAVDAAAGLLQLMLGDHQPHRMHLQDDVHQRDAERTGQHDLGIRPGHRGAAHDLGPGGERAPRRQLQRVVADDWLLRIAGPGDRQQLLLAEPHQVIGPRGRQLHRQHATGQRRQRIQRRVLARHRRAGEGRLVDARGRPRPAMRAALAWTAPRPRSGSRRRGTAPPRWPPAAAAACAGCGTVPAASRLRSRWPRSAAARGAAPGSRPAHARNSRSRRCAWRSPPPAAHRPSAPPGPDDVCCSGGRRPGPTTGRRAPERSPASR